MSEQNHPWCSDVSRDEAIRRAEDAAAAERPALPDHRELPSVVHDLRRRLEGLETVADHWRRQCEAAAVAENREAAVVSRDGVTFTENGVFREAKTPSGAVNPAADASGGDVDGLRDIRDSRNAKADGLLTERVTLEITQRAETYAPFRELNWQRILRQTPGGLWEGESVRVVDYATIGSGDVFADVGCGSTGEEIVRLTAERDAAKEEAEKATTLAKGLEEKRAYFRRERDVARDECERLRLRVAELEAAPAANAGGEANYPAAPDSSQEPVAWGVDVGNGLPVWRCSSERQAHAVVRWLTVQRPGSSPAVVPLMDGRAAPPPPRGWLTSEERSTLGIVVTALRAAAVVAQSDASRSVLTTQANDMDALLARSTPPRVKVPAVVTGFTHREHAEGWVKAIREAGGEVE